MMGGAEFMIDGQGYDEVPSVNQVKFMFEHTEFEPNVNFTGPAISGTHLA